MVKRILLSIVMLALIAYLIVAITAFNRKPADQTCRDMELVIKDTAYAGFITKDELKGILQQKGIYPIGKKMERISTKSLERELNRVIVTGNVEKSFAMKDLYKFGVFLHNNKFWDALIEQIHVLPDRNIELVPRVGDHLVYLGKLDNFEDKLARLKEFYKKGLNQVGWNKYSRINLEFSNQIICTKRENKK